MEKPEFYFSHVGINEGSPKETEEMVKFCRLLFGAGDIQESAHAYFAGDRTMEIQKGGGPGPERPCGVLYPGSEGGHGLPGRMRI